MPDARSPRCRSAADARKLSRRRGAGQPRRRSPFGPAWSQWFARPGRPTPPALCPGINAAARFERSLPAFPYSRTASPATPGLPAESGAHHPSIRSRIGKAKRSPLCSPAKKSIPRLGGPRLIAGGRQSDATGDSGRGRRRDDKRPAPILRRASARELPERRVGRQRRPRAAKALAFAEKGRLCDADRYIGLRGGELRSAHPVVVVERVR